MSSSSSSPPSKQEEQRQQQHEDRDISSPSGDFKRRRGNSISTFMSCKKESDETTKRRSNDSLSDNKDDEEEHLTKPITLVQSTSLPNQLLRRLSLTEPPLMVEEEEEGKEILQFYHSATTQSEPSRTIFRRQIEKNENRQQQQEENKELKLELQEEKEKNEDSNDSYLAGTDYTSYTQDTSKADEEYDEESNKNSKRIRQTVVSWDNDDDNENEEEENDHRKRLPPSSSSILRTNRSELTETDAATFHPFNTLFIFIPQSVDIKYILYLSTYAIIGSSIRSFLARFFGSDCESSFSDDALSSLSSSICVTSKSSAIFIDLPANILGCFIMGVMATLSDDWPPVPCLKATHSVQSKSYIHVSLKTGLCGSLTTFASWNSQMVTMMEKGSLSDILSALFGYVIGLQCAIGSFTFGTRVSTWLNRWKNPSLVPFVAEGEEIVMNRTRRWTSRTRRGSHDGRQIRYHHRNNKRDWQSKQKGKEVITSSSNEILGKEVSSKSNMSNGDASNIDSITTNNSNNNNHHKGKIQQTKYIFQEYILHYFSKIFYIENIPFLIVSCLLLTYILSDVMANISFYRFMWLSSLLTPPGALLRWKLSKLNGTIFQRHQNMKWIPFGTFLANLLGSLISISLVAIHAHLFNTVDGYTNNSWGALVLKAAKVGFAGSLSTVSTYVKEIVDIGKKYPQHAKSWYYAVGSIGICCLLSLMIYCPIVRSI